MTWRPSKLTRVQMTERRLEGARLLEQGTLTQHEIAQRLGVDQSAVSRWARRLHDHGPDALQPTTSAGRPATLTPEAIHRLLTDLDKGPAHWGYPGGRWTLKRIADLLARTQGVRFHRGHVHRILRTAGYSPQLPQRRAMERNEQAIETWKNETYPELKRGQSSGEKPSSSSTRSARASNR